MNIIVAVKQIPDLQQIRIRNRQPVLEGVPYTLGKIDKNALETGVRLKESHGGNLIVVSAGNEEVEETIKEALAAGADEACLVLDDRLSEIESSLSAHLLAAVIGKLEDVGLVILGEGSGDNYSGQVGSRVGELLGLPQVGYASRIELEGPLARITRSLEDREEILEVRLPVVVSILGDVNEPRIPSVTQILKAGRKPQTIIELDELGIEMPKTNKITTLSNRAPENDRKRIALKTVTELVTALQTEGFMGRESK
ncbi:MAG: electron transfer flavoprotein subunit beta/FixA family protein [Syntrophomonadaceae bacterium]|nr:electron transfer flavoprotein subunit beta/FixA family protein [Syntrophomonadaceae bacterium]